MVKPSHIISHLATLASVASLASAGRSANSARESELEETVTQVMTATVIATSSLETTTAAAVTDEPVITITEVKTTTAQATTTAQTPSSSVNTTQPADVTAPELECWYFYDHHSGSRHWFIQAPMVHDDEIHRYCGGLWDNLHRRMCTVTEPFCGPRRQPMWYTPGAVGVEPDGVGGGVPAWGTGLFWQFTTSTLCFARQVEEAWHLGTDKSRFGKLSCPVEALRYNPTLFPANEWYDPNLWGHNPYMADYNALPILGNSTRRSVEFDGGGEYNATIMLQPGGNDTALATVDRETSRVDEIQHARGVQEVNTDPETDFPRNGSYFHHTNMMGPKIVDLIAAREKDDIKIPPPHELMSSAAGPEWHYNTSCLKQENKDMRSHFNIKAPKVPLWAVEDLCEELSLYLLNDPGVGHILCKPYYFSAHACKPLHPKRGGLWWYWVNYTNDCHRGWVEQAWIEVTKGKWGPLFCYSGCDPIYDGTYPKWCKVQGVSDSPCC